MYRDKANDHDFDIILQSIDEITGNITVTRSEPHYAAISSKKITTNALDGDVIEYESVVPVMIVAKEMKAKRIAKIQYDDAVKAGEKVKQAEFIIDPTMYIDDDIIFRVNTFEHIPLAPPKISKVKPTRKKIVESALLTTVEDDNDAPTVKTKYTKVNFPPFYHYRYQNGILTQVAKSHWKGDYNNGAFDGEFCKEHGHMTEKLAMMFMKLCERYATKSNWRGYTYNDEMRGMALLQLSTIGLQFNEDKSQNPFAYYTAVVNNAFTRVLNIEKRNQVIRDDILEANDLTPSYTRQNENEMVMRTERMKKGVGVL